MTLENPELRSQETKAAGLVKGETACNRSACQAPLNRYDGLGWWNTETRAYYCPSCAKRINESSKVSLGRAICITESEKWLLDTDEILADAAKRITSPNYTKLK
jgi:phage terminase large subunit GpA-like protein